MLEGLLIGGLVGALIAWWLVSTRARAQAVTLANEVVELTVRAESQAARAETAERELAAEQARRAAREEADAQTRSVFESLAGDALGKASEQFLKLAEERLGKSEQKNTSELEKRKEAIDAMLKPVGKSLDEVQRLQRELELKREKAYGSLEIHLKELKDSTGALGLRSQALEQALKGSSQARGRWGEVVLRRVVEMAGMTQHCDFIEQSQDDQGQRPDMVVLLPENGKIPIDSKVPLDAYDDAVRAEDPVERKAHLVRHAAALKGFVRQLGRKQYAEGLEGRIDFTVLFVPAEPMLAAAFEADPNLMEDAFDRGILLTTPVTLMALLRTVSLYWKQVSLADNAKLLGDAVDEYSKRVRVFSEHIVNVGKGLERSVKAYNSAVGSFERKVLPSARRVEELGGASGKAVLPEAPKEIDETPRELSSGE